MSLLFKVHMDEGNSWVSDSDPKEDFFEKFIEDSKLAGTLGPGGREIVKHLHETAAQIRFVEPGESLEKTDGEWEEKIGDDSTLEKRATSEPGARRKLSLTKHIRRQLAAGETIAALAEYAAKHDAETSRLILEIGTELEAS